MLNYLWKYSLTLQVWICSKAAIQAGTCIFESLLKNCQRCNFTNSLANPRLPNQREAALPSCPTSISACSSAVPASVWADLLADLAKNNGKRMCQKKRYLLINPPFEKQLRLHEFSQPFICWSTLSEEDCVSLQGLQGAL